MYTIEQHTADVRLRVRAATLPQLFEDAALGMMAVMRPEVGPGASAQSIDLVTESADVIALLVDFLSDILLQTHLRRFVCERVAITTLAPMQVTATATGRSASGFDEEIKAVTYHEADVVQGSDGWWETGIVFDI